MGTELGGRTKGLPPLRAVQANAALKKRPTDSKKRAFVQDLSRSIKRNKMHKINGNKSSKAKS